MLKMLVDLKVTNEIHSNEFSKSQNIFNQMETTGTQNLNSRQITQKSFASQ